MRKFFSMLKLENILICGNKKFVIIELIYKNILILSKLRDIEGNK